MNNLPLISILLCSALLTACGQSQAPDAASQSAVAPPPATLATSAPAEPDKPSDATATCQTI